MTEYDNSSKPTQPLPIATEDETRYAPSFVLDELACPPRAKVTLSQEAPTADPIPSSHE